MARALVRFARTSSLTQQRAQHVVARDVRVLKWGSDLRVLLGLNQDPALVAVLDQEAVGLGEVDGAVAGHGEHAGQERIEEGALGLAGLLHLGGAHVLEVHVLDAVDRAAQQAHDVAVAHECVARVEEQGDLVRVGQLEHAQRLILGLNDGAQVVVVDQVKAVLVGDLAELVQALGQDRPLLILEDGLVLEDADVADPLHRTGLLGDDDAGRAQELQVLAGGAEVRDDGVDAVADDEAGEPLGDDLQARCVGLLLRLFLRGVPAGDLGASKAGLGQVVEHDVDGVPFADLGNIVVTPRNRVHSPGDAIGVVDRGCGIVDVSHCSSPMSRGCKHRREVPVPLFYSILSNCPDKESGLGDIPAPGVRREHTRMSRPVKPA